LALEKVVEETLVATRQPTGGTPELNPEKWLRRFIAWSESPAHANLPDLPDEALSREFMYKDRGL
jgi:hypothetical protein